MKHTIVWIDHKEARIFEAEGGTTDQSVVVAPGRHVHRHANEQDLRIRNHPDDEHRFFREVIHALEGAGRILLVGPAQTKLHFLRFLQKDHQPLEQRIVGVESADHPTDAQLLAHLRRYFHEPADQATS